MRCGGWSVGFEWVLHSQPNPNLAGKNAPKRRISNRVGRCNACGDCVFETSRARERTVAVELTPLKGSRVVCQAVYKC